MATKTKKPYNSKEYHKEYYSTRKVAYRERNFKNKYKISLEDYDNLLKKQNFRCPLCFRHVSEIGRPLFVDHCHTTGVVRGLLCLGCNAGLGMLGDTVESLKLAVKYLEGEL